MNHSWAVVLALFVSLAIFAIFFNRYCIFPACKVCPHMTPWEYWSQP